MIQECDFDVAVIGGSMAGLSAALTLGRALRRAVLFDGGEPCNRYSEAAHNLVLADGIAPSEILANARAALKPYPTISHVYQKVSGIQTLPHGFILTAEDGEEFSAKKIILCTGISDEVSGRPGFKECFGKTLLHCPYCHGYEWHDKVLGVLADGAQAFELCRLLHQWSKHLILFTDGGESIDLVHAGILARFGIPVVTEKIQLLTQENGILQSVQTGDGREVRCDVLFTSFPFKQSGDLYKQLGCALTASGYIFVDHDLQTSVKGVFAAGDCSSAFRALHAAMSSGAKAAACVNKQLCEEAFV